MGDKAPETATSAALPATPTGDEAEIDARAILIVIGVSGSGKSTIATVLAQRLGWPLQEGDALYPLSDNAKTHSAHPLDDRDQWSWLEKVAAWIDGCRQLGTGGVITCSALKRSHRDFLTRGRPLVRIIYLHGERTLIASRLASRGQHSMLPDLLDRHLAILEEPDLDENPILIDVSLPVEDIVAEILRELAPQAPENRLGVARDDSARPTAPPVKPCGPQSHASTAAQLGRMVPA